MVIIDTNIIIDHLRQTSDQSKLVKLLEENDTETFGISVISVQELYEGQSTKNEEKELHLLSTLSSFKILSYNIEVAQLAGKIARDSNVPVDFADASIAATAIINEAQLATLNTKHFEDLSDLQLFDFSGFKSS